MNYSSITEKSLKYLTEVSKPEELDDDWARFFFDKARIISDEEMQEIWGRILAEEINSPNTVGKSLLHTLSIISKQEAVDFRNLCRYCLYSNAKLSSAEIIYFHEHMEYFNKQKISPVSLQRLSNKGLITYDINSIFGWNIKENTFFYHAKKILVKASAKAPNRINFGNITLPSDGFLLFKIIENNFDQNILDNIISQFRSIDYEVIVDDIIL